MARAPAKSAARKPASLVPAPVSPAAPVAPGPAVPQEPRSRWQEPVWLVRIVLVLFLVGFAAFLAREVRNFVSVLP